MRPRYARLLGVLWCTVALLQAHVGGVARVDAGHSGAQRLGTATAASDFIKSLQRELKRAGYDPGVVDGKMGPSTQRALKRFQAAHGLAPSGEPDIPTLTKLLGQSLPH
jgi:peptidoglycan hydrolase-like protein with peptidoglycan-binding domain